MSDTTVSPDRRPAFSDRVRRAASNGRLTAALILLPPALILFTLFVILPLGESGMYAFYDWNGYGTPEDFVGLRNFEQMLGHSVFSVAVGNTVKIVVVSLVIQMPLALLLALLIFR